MGFKMRKGSPMKRNYNMEESPVKNYRNPQEYEVFNMGNKATPFKQDYDVHGTDKRAYKVDQNKYDAWRKESGSDAPDVRYLGQKENKLHLEKFLDSQKEKDEPKKESKLEKKSGSGGHDPRIGRKKNIKSSEKLIEEEEEKLPGLSGLKYKKEKTGPRANPKSEKTMRFNKIMDQMSTLTGDLKNKRAYDTLKVTSKQPKTPSQGDWTPAFPGADHSEEDLRKMTDKEKRDYYN